MADKDDRSVDEIVREMIKPSIRKMRDNHIDKDYAIRISGQSYEFVDAIYSENEKRDEKKGK